MSQQHDIQKPYTEADILLAISDISSRRVKSVKRAAEIYNVPRLTLQTQRARIPLRADCEPNSKKMNKLEEEAIVRRIIEESDQGFAPTKQSVREMADTLLQARGAEPVGKNWVDNFVKRTPEVKQRWSRPYDYQRAKCEDPAIIKRWFDVVKEWKQKWGIIDDDIYNFDETGFMMGKILL